MWVSFQWISVPFALSNPAVASIGVTAVEKVHQEPWLGSISPSNGWMWVDNFCLLVNTSSQSTFCAIPVLKDYIISVLVPHM